MSYTRLRTWGFGSGTEGNAATVQFQVLNPDGTVLAAWSGAGVLDLGGGFYGAPVTLPDAFSGFLQFQETSTGSRAAMEINPQEPGGDLVAERNAIADALLDRVDAIETGLSLRNAQRLIAAALAGLVSGANLSLPVFRSAVSGAKNRISATTDAYGNRSVVTTDLT